ncbi:MAG: hypothetical protein PHX10_13270 [Gallionellaceae bacterium]|nr:hypothetical protein [Gallionellaceae bacterium]
MLTLVSLALTEMPLAGGDTTRTMVSAPSITPRVFPSTNTITACPQLPEVVHVTLSALLHTVTVLPRLMASDRARATKATNSFAVALTRFCLMKSTNDGTATVASIATMVIVTINSISVTPRQLRISSPLSALGMIFVKPHHADAMQTSGVPHTTNVAATTQLGSTYTKFI